MKWPKWSRRQRAERQVPFQQLVGQSLRPGESIRSALSVAMLADMLDANGAAVDAVPVELWIGAGGRNFKVPIPEPFRQLVIEERRRRQAPAPAPAFTLVDLLVVIVVIAVLMAILIPILCESMNAARNAQCLSNLRQTALSFSVYHTGNPGVWPMGWEDLGLNPMECPANRARLQPSYVLRADYIDLNTGVHWAATCDLLPSSGVLVAQDCNAYHGWANAAYLDGSARELGP